MDLALADWVAKKIPESIAAGKAVHQRDQKALTDPVGQAEDLVKKTPAFIQRETAQGKTEGALMLLVEGVDIVDGKLRNTAALVHHYCEHMDLFPRIVQQDLGDGPEDVLIISWKHFLSK